MTRLTDTQIEALDKQINRIPIKMLMGYIRNGYIDEYVLDRLVNIRPELKERLLDIILPPKSRPISMDTTKICYCTHTHSGTAIYDIYTISEGQMEWENHHYRNAIERKKRTRFDKTDFKNLVRRLSSIVFSAENMLDPPLGAGGWSYSFENANGRYLSFDNYSHFSGDYHAVIDTIQQFIEQNSVDPNS